MADRARAGCRAESGLPAPTRRMRAIPRPYRLSRCWPSTRRQNASLLISSYSGPGYVNANRVSRVWSDEPYLRVICITSGLVILPVLPWKHQHNGVRTAACVRSIGTIGRLLLAACRPMDGDRRRTHPLDPNRPDTTGRYRACRACQAIANTMGVAPDKTT